LDLLSAAAKVLTMCCFLIKESTMPYFMFKVFPGKKLEVIRAFDDFKQARVHARELRTAVGSQADYAIKIMFAKSELEAQMLLKEEREYRPMGDD
jgi:hypothetical protein